MTASQYKRLCLVLFVPLLLTGYLVATYALPYNRFQVVMCQQFVGGDNNCVSASSLDSPLYKHMKQLHKAWFDVELGPQERGSITTSLPMASGRLLEDVEILKDKPYWMFGPDVGRFVDGMAGRRGMIQLGIPDKELSLVSSDRFLLLCHNIRYQGTPGVYSSRCFGDGWTAPFKYRVLAQDRDMLEGLKAEIHKSFDDKVTEYRIYQAVMYPAFVYLFLNLSALVWLTGKAVQYVRRG
jgi:hypothetical protein